MRVGSCVAALQVIMWQSNGPGVVFVAVSPRGGDNPNNVKQLLHHYRTSCAKIVFIIIIINIIIIIDF